MLARLDATSVIGSTKARPPCPTSSAPSDIDTSSAARGTGKLADVAADRSCRVVNPLEDRRARQVWSIRLNLHLERTATRFDAVDLFSSASASRDPKLEQRSRPDLRFRACAQRRLW